MDFRGLSWSISAGQTPYQGPIYPVQLICYQDTEDKARTSSRNVEGNVCLITISLVMYGQGTAIEAGQHAMLQ